MSKTDPRKQGIDNALLVRQYMEEHDVSTAKACEALSVSVNNYYRYARDAGIALQAPIGGHRKRKAATPKAPEAKAPAPRTPVAAEGRMGQKPGQVMLVVGNPADVAAILGKIM